VTQDERIALHHETLVSLTTIGAWDRGESTSKSIDLLLSLASQRLGFVRKFTPQTTPARNKRHPAATKATPVGRSNVKQAIRKGKRGSEGIGG
jgi:hypothetical protein